MFDWELEVHTRQMFDWELKVRRRQIFGLELEVRQLQKHKTSISMENLRIPTIPTLQPWFPQTVSQALGVSALV